MKGFFLPRTQYGQHGHGHHGESNMPVPALPVPDFVVIQPAFAFGHLESDFERTRSGKPMVDGSGQAG